MLDKMSLIVIRIFYIVDHTGIELLSGALSLFTGLSLVAGFASFDVASTYDTHDYLLDRAGGEFTWGLIALSVGMFQLFAVLRHLKTLVVIDRKSITSANLPKVSIAKLSIGRVRIAAAFVSSAFFLVSAIMFAYSELMSNAWVYNLVISFFDWFVFLRLTTIRRYG